MTCEDCIHYDVCSYEESNISGNEFANKVEELCGFLKDKSIFVELPCMVGDTVYKITELDEIQREETGYTMNYDIFEGEVQSITMDGKTWVNVFYETGLRMWYVIDEVINKTVFTSYEEAVKQRENLEKALKESNK